MIKEHNTTGLRYLCVTSKDDHNSYKGSGKYWTTHIKKHGYDVTTTVIFESPQQHIFDAKSFEISKEYDVVNSQQWANLCHETGFKKSVLGLRHTEESKVKMSRSSKRLSGWKHTEESKILMAKAAKSQTHLPMTEAARKKLSQSNKGKPRSKAQHDATLKAHRVTLVCPYCGHIGNYLPTMYRWHFEKCRNK